MIYLIELEFYVSKFIVKIFIDLKSWKQFTLLNLVWDIIYLSIHLKEINTSIISFCILIDFILLLCILTNRKLWFWLDTRTSFLSDSFDELRPLIDRNASNIWFF